MRAFIFKSVSLAKMAVAVVCLVLFQADDANALNRWVQVINNSSQTMMNFYASNRDRTTWEEDILGRRVLRPGQRIKINIDDGTGYCIYDMRAVFANGAEAVRWNANVCELATWTITD